MEIPKKQRGREDVYAPALKIAIAREYLTTSLGFVKLAKKYDLPGEATVRHFVRWYRHKYPDGKTDETPGLREAEVPPAGRQELTEANLRITALEMLIENAGKELGVDLVKKFGTRQPKK